MANPTRSLLPLASAIWSLRTLTLTAQILLDPKLGFLGTVLEQHSHKHMARALPARAALPTSFHRVVVIPGVACAVSAVPLLDCTFGKTVWECLRFSRSWPVMHARDMRISFNEEQVSSGSYAWLYESVRVLFHTAYALGMQGMPATTRCAS